MRARYNILIIGCGGTGGNFASMLGRYLYDNDVAKSCSITFVDGDYVENKNIGRQPFLPCDVGRNKAEVMAEVLTEVFGVQCGYYPKYIDSLKDIENLEKYGYVTVIIGCVDNHACRKVLHEYFKTAPVCYYLDSANEFSSGEVVVGLKIGGKIMSPDRAIIFPEILEDKSLPRSEESCEVLNNSRPQHLATNMLAATILFKCTVELFVEEMWNGGVYYFDTFKGSVLFKEVVQV